MRVVRSILASPAARRPPIYLTRLAVASHTRPCGRAHSSSLAVEPGFGQDLEHLFKQPSTPSNNTPNQNSSEDDLLTPLRQYQKLIDTGVLRGDDHQTRIIQKLQDLHDNLLHYNPPHIPRPSQSISLVRTYSTVDMFGT